MTCSSGTDGKQIPTLGIRPFKVDHGERYPTPQPTRLASGDAWSSKSQLYTLPELLNQLASLGIEVTSLNKTGILNIVHKRTSSV